VRGSLSPRPSAPRITVQRTPFRRDVQGLRALAVLLVLIYHAAPDTVSGGYIGVDVFFVISGYLITNHLLARISSTGRVGFADFYARRARRILPASFAVVVLTVVSVQFFVPPALRAGLLQDAIWTVFYVPNLSFAIDGTNYLAETAPSPFLHYWSLGVEEQFYLLWPLLLIALVVAARGTRRRLVPMVTLLAGASFAFGWWLTYASQPWAYFGIASRAWELAAGALVAVAGPRLVDRLPQATRAAVGWVGLGLVVFAALRFDALTPFPGGSAAIPVLGAVFVIGSGQVPAVGGPRAILSTRPMQFVGRISYSLYLVHWPLIVIPFLASGAPLPTYVAVTLAVIAIPLAWLLTVTVEDPIRRSRLASAKPAWSLAAAGTASVAIALLAVGGIALAQRVPLDAGRLAPTATPAPTPTPTQSTGQITAPGESHSYPVFTDYVPSNMEPSLESASQSVPIIYSNGCHLDVPSVEVKGCAFGDPTSNKRIALFGDSHAAQWMPALHAIGTSDGLRIETYTKSSCPSVDVAVYVNAIEYSECDAWRNAVIAELAADPPALVVISNMADQPNQPGGGIDPDEWAQGLARVIDRIGAPVLVIVDTPRQPETPATCLSAHLEDARVCGIDRAEAINSRWESIERIAAESAGASVVDLNDYICDATRCDPIIGSTLVYRDAHHLTVEFVERLQGPLREAVLQELGSSSAENKVQQP